MIPKFIDLEAHRGVENRKEVSKYDFRSFNVLMGLELALCGFWNEETMDNVY